jgi:hypothetical protein
MIHTGSLLKSQYSLIVLQIKLTSVDLMSRPTVFEKWSNEDVVSYFVNIAPAYSEWGKTLAQEGWTGVSISADPASFIKTIEKSGLPVGHRLRALHAFEHVYHNVRTFPLFGPAGNGPIVCMSSKSFDSNVLK